MTPHINLFVISGSGEPGFPYLVTMRLSRDIEIFVKRREIGVEINHKRVKRFPSSLFVLLRFGTDKQQVYRRNISIPNLFLFGYFLFPFFHFSMTMLSQLGVYIYEINSRIR